MSRPKSDSSLCLCVSLVLVPAHVWTLALISLLRKLKCVSRILNVLIENQLESALKWRRHIVWQQYDMAQNSSRIYNTNVFQFKWPISKYSLLKHHLFEAFRVQSNLHFYHRESFVCAPISYHVLAVNKENTTSDIVLNSYPFFLTTLSSFETEIWVRFHISTKTTIPQWGAAMLVYTLEQQCMNLLGCTTRDHAPSMNIYTTAR